MVAVCVRRDLGDFGACGQHLPALERLVWRWERRRVLGYHRRAIASLFWLVVAVCLRLG
jgi:hypothetical protein